MRQFAAFLLLLAAAGCDTGDDVRPFDDVMIVELKERVGLQLETESYAFCGTPIYVSSRSSPGALDVYVEGARQGVGGCDALKAGQWSTALHELPLDLSIYHNGSTDRYRITANASGVELVAIETSTTRLGPR